MYIVLSGKVDIYIDGSRSGEDLETGREAPPPWIDGSDIATLNQEKKSLLKFTDVELAIRAARATKKGNTQAGHVTQISHATPGAEPRVEVIDERNGKPPEGSTSPRRDMNNNLDEPIAEFDRKQFGQLVVQFGRQLGKWHLG